MKGRCSVTQSEIDAEVTVTPPSHWKKTTKCELTKRYKRNPNGGIDRNILIDYSEDKIAPPIFLVKVRESTFDLSNIKYDSDYITYNKLDCTGSYADGDIDYINSIYGISKSEVSIISGLLLFKANGNDIKIQGLRLQGPAEVCEFQIY